MTYAVKDRVTVSLWFNDVLFDLRFNSLDYIHIVESVRLYVPQLTLSITDATKFFATHDFLLDGTVIKIQLTREQQLTTYKFRLFSFKDYLRGPNTRYFLYGYLDTPLFWSASTTEPQFGTSSAVLQSIAAKCGLSFKGTNTADSQLWFPANRTYKEWADDIAQHGYQNSQSCMVQAVTTDAVLVYKDVSLFNSQPVTEQFALGIRTDTILPIQDFKVLNKSGFYNTRSGYADQITQWASDSTHSTAKTVEVQRNSAKFMLNKEIKSDIDQHRVSFGPVDFGNVHSNYIESQYKNNRLANLFSYGLEILTDAAVQSRILDVVNCTINVPNSGNSKQFTGKFLVSSRVVYVNGINYFQKLEWCRHGVNDSLDTTQE